MPNEHFCLKWNNFQRNIVAALGNLKLDEDFVDVTISCEGGKLIKAHKVILSACSDYFRDLFRENPCQHPVIILRDASYTDVEGLVRYVYRGEVDVQPQHLQSFLKTADALKIKGLADQGLVPDHGNQDQTRSSALGTNSSATSAGSLCSANPVVDKSELVSDKFGLVETDESAVEDESMSSFELQQPPLYSNPSPRIEPLRVPIPPSNFRSTCSNSSIGSSIGSSSLEDSSIILHPPDPKRMRMSTMSPNLPLNLVSANSQQQQPPLAVVIPQAPTPIFNPPSSANQIVLDSNPTGLCQNPVPLVKKKQPTALASDSDRNSLVITEDQQPYPPPSQSPLFLQQPNSPNPKHINNSSALQVETGTLATDSEEAFSIERKPSIKLNSTGNSNRKKKIKKEIQQHLTAGETGNNPLSGSAVASAVNSGPGISGLTGALAGSLDDPADNNNTENNGTHPRNRWRCMQPRLCNYCWKTFSNSFNLKQHIVNVHIQSQGVSCSLCDKVVKNKWYLRKHLVTAHGAPLKRVTTKPIKENGSADTNMSSDTSNPGSNSTTSMTMMTMHSSNNAIIGQSSPTNSTNSDSDQNNSGPISTIEETKHSNTNVNNSAVNRLSTTTC